MTGARLLILSSFVLMCECASFQFHSFDLVQNVRRRSRCRIGALSENFNDYQRPVRPDQQHILTLRGEIEEKLMAKNLSPLEVKLGDFCDTLRNDGVVRIDNVLSENTANCLRDYVLDLERRSTTDVEKGEVRFSERFANVLLNKSRCDLKIPLGPSPVMNALKELLQSPVRHTIATVLAKGTESCTLYELSCLISRPGSQRQNVHPDHPFVIPKENDGRDNTSLEPLALTCFVALQDITPDMGPTIWIPGTHNRQEAHDRFQRRRVEDLYCEFGLSPKDQLLRDAPTVAVGLLPIGSCAIFDSRILHCGTANRQVPVATAASTTGLGFVETGAEEESGLRSKSIRALFYVTFKHPNVGFPGNEGSIGYGLEDSSLQLGELCRTCEQHTGSDERRHHLYRHP
ncbi:phytanoyl-CoA dioxygenase [Fragilaria crotonensis]|nr:phytanoyl-CoA dioxygenase [Fragilaria crotonensis]